MSILPFALSGADNRVNINNDLVNIYSLDGKEVFSKSLKTGLNAGRVKLSLTGLKNGMYLIRTATDDLLLADYINVL